MRDGGDRLENLEKMVNAVEETQKRGLNRAEHRLHLRCELPHHTTLPLFEKLIDRESVSMVSLMDHSPGQRQYADRSKYRDYYQGKYHLTHDEMDRFEAEQMALAATGRSPIARPSPPCAAPAVSPSPATTTPPRRMWPNLTS